MADAYRKGTRKMSSPASASASVSGTGTVELQTKSAGDDGQPMPDLAENEAVKSVSVDDEKRSPAASVSAVSQGTIQSTMAKAVSPGARYVTVEDDILNIACRIYGDDLIKRQNDNVKGSDKSLIQLYLGESTDYEKEGWCNCIFSFDKITFYLYTYFPWYVRNITTIVFGFSFFEKLPTQMFAVQWQGADPDKQSLLPFSGGDQFVFPFAIAYLVPLVLLLLIVTTYFRTISGTVEQYAHLTHDAAPVEDPERKNASGRRQTVMSHHDENYLYIRDSGSNQLKQVPIGSKEYDKLMHCMQDIALHKVGFVKILIVFQYLSLVALFIGRFGLCFGGNITAQTELGFVCVGMAGFLSKMLADFIRLQVRASNRANEAPNSLRFFHLLTLFYSFEVGYMTVVALLYHIMSKVWRNWVDISWSGNGIIVAYLEAIVYIICGTWIFIIDFIYLKRRSEFLQTEWTKAGKEVDVNNDGVIDEKDQLAIEEILEGLMSSRVWTHLNSDIIVRGCNCCNVAECGTCNKDCCYAVSKKIFINFFDISATISAMATLMLIIDFVSAPVTLYRRAYNDTRASNWQIDTYLILMVIMWYGCMMFHARLVRLTISRMCSFVTWRIVWGACLVVPFFLYQIDRGQNKDELAAENEPISIITQICTPFVMIFTPVLLINLTVSLARMLTMPHLQLIIGLIIATFIVVLIKLVALAMIASQGSYSLGLGFTLLLQMFLAFAPMAMKVSCYSLCEDNPDEDIQEEIKEEKDERDRTESAAKMIEVQGKRCARFVMENHLCMNKTSVTVMTGLLFLTIAGIIYSSTVIEDDKKRDRFRIGSFNLHLGFNRAFDFDTRHMVEKMRKSQDKYHDIDFLCVQEIGTGNWMMGGSDILDYFSFNLGFKYGSYGANQIAPAGFNMGLLSKIPFKKITRYSLPNPKYESNMVLVEIDGKKYYDQDDDVVIACAHLATGNEKSDQITSMAELGAEATAEGKSFIMIADWNIDLHTRCNVTCENNYDMCVDLIDAAEDAGLREIFWEHTVNKSIDDYLLLRSNERMQKLLDFAWINDKFTTIYDATIIDYDKCMRDCCYENDAGNEVDDEVLQAESNSTCCGYKEKKIDGKKTPVWTDICKYCSGGEACEECSPSDHIPVFFEIGWD